VKINLDGYETAPISRANYADVWEVYESNPDYFVMHKGRVAEFADVLDTFERLVEGYDSTKQYFVGFWRDGCCAAVLELLPDFPYEGELWLSEIIVHGGLHGQGLGSKIVQAVIAAAKAYSQIKLGTDPHLSKFWQKHGFIQMPQNGDFIGFQLTNK